MVEVYDSGSVQISDGKRMGTVVILKGIPHETALQIGLDSRLDGTGNVGEVSTFLGINIEIDVTNLQIK